MLASATARPARTRLPGLLDRAGASILAFLVLLCAPASAQVDVARQSYSHLVVRDTVVRPLAPRRPATAPEWDRSYGGEGDAQVRFAFEATDDSLKTRSGGFRNRFAMTYPDHYTYNFFEIRIASALPDSGCATVWLNPSQWSSGFFGNPDPGRPFFGKIYLWNIDGVNASQSGAFEELVRFGDLPKGGFGEYEFCFKYPTRWTPPYTLYWTVYILEMYSESIYPIQKDSSYIGVHASVIENMDEMLKQFGLVPTAAEALPTVSTLELGNPFPNPSRGLVRIPILGAPGARARVSVYDLLGREVAVLLEGEVISPELQYDTSSLPAGVYVVRATATGASSTRRLVVR